MSANVIENLEAKIKELKPDQVHLFNDRFAEQNVIIEVCTKQKIDYYKYERISIKGKYKFFKNMLPHSLAHRGYELERLRQEVMKLEHSFLFQIFNTVS
jgi:hypothetical protein